MGTMKLKMFAKLWDKSSQPLQTEMRVLLSHESWGVGARENGEKPLVFSAGPAVGWGELWGDGKKEGRAKAGWVTWAFVGRWWEAPPWPLALNVKQHCHCLASAAADACAAVSLATRNRNKLPPHPPPTTAPSLCPPLFAMHTYMPLNACASQDYPITHTHQQHPPSGDSQTLGKARQGITCTLHSWPLRSKESERSDKWWH